MELVKCDDELVIRVAEDEVRLEELDDADLSLAGGGLAFPFIQ